MMDGLEVLVAISTATLSRKKKGVSLLRPLLFRDTFKT